MLLIAIIVIIAINLIILAVVVMQWRAHYQELWEHIFALETDVDALKMRLEVHEREST